MMVVSRALAPIQPLSQAMTKIESGGYDTRVKPDGPPELAAICTKLNHLAAALGDAVDDKRRLAERVVSLQDVERRRSHGNCMMSSDPIFSRCAPTPVP